MLLEQTHEKLIAMKLYGMALALKTRLERIDHQSLTREEFFSLLVDDEWLYRENRKLVSRLKVAKFKERAAALEDIDYRTPRDLRKTQVLELAQHTAGSKPTSASSSPAPAAWARATSPKPSAITPAATASACSTCVCRRC